MPRKIPITIYDFDDRITAPLSGFEDAEDYYANASSGPRLKDIEFETRILAAEDDPVVSYAAIKNAQRSPSVELYATQSGGHLGFLTAARHESNRRWMDRLITEWVTEWS